MKRVLTAAAAALLSISLLGLAPPQSTWTLPQVLDHLTAAAPKIHSLQAAAAVVDYTALVDEADHSSGKLYFEAHGPRYVLDLIQPRATAKKLLYVDHTAYVYTPSAKQVMKYPLGKNPAGIDQYLLLGMGATGADLTRAFTVTLDGPVQLKGKVTVELTLTPRSDKLKSKITRLDIWYNPRTWIGVQQKIWQPGGDYHLLTLSAIKLNPKLSDPLFSTSFPGATVITPHF
ncbi:MAG: outer membrane lipoprotein carrier protein LolA [Acidobacteria bacterium]|nr:MAG: outer membrane lipoprotein carrier protein LolA [Acidobacteriota bacterium]